MRALLLALLVAASSLQAADPAPVDRNAAYERVRDSGKVAILVERAGTELSRGRDEAALAAASEAVELAPKNPDALNTKAAALIKLERYSEAEPLLEEALAINPDHFDAQFNRAEALFLQGKYSDALAEFRLLFTKYPSRPVLKFKLYLACHMAGRDDLASEVLRTLRFPSDGVAWYYAQAADKLIANDPRAAKKLLKTARAIHPDEAPRYDEALTDAGLLK